MTIIWKQCSSKRNIFDQAEQHCILSAKMYISLYSTVECTMTRRQLRISRGFVNTLEKLGKDRYMYTQKDLIRNAHIQHMFASRFYWCWHLWSRCKGRLEDIIKGLSQKNKVFDSLNKWTNGERVNTSTFAQILNRCRNFEQQVWERCGREDRRFGNYNDQITNKNLKI